jgi:hypothetical protein
MHLTELLDVERSGPVPRAEESEVDHSPIGTIIEFDLEVDHVLEMTSVTAAVLFEDVAARVRAIEDSVALPRSLPGIEVIPIEVEDVLRVRRGRTVVSDEAVAVEPVEEALDESRFAHAIRA